MNYRLTPALIIVNELSKKGSFSVNEDNKGYMHIKQVNTDGTFEFIFGLGCIEEFSFVFSNNNTHSVKTEIPLSFVEKNKTNLINSLVNYTPRVQ